MSILAHNLLRLFAQDLSGYEHQSAPTLYNKFLANSGVVDPGDVLVADPLDVVAAVPVRVERRALDRLEADDARPVRLPFVPLAAKRMTGGGTSA